MSEDENTNESKDTTNQPEQAAETTSNTDDASKAAGNILSKVLELKDSNPKVFFGAIGGFVLVILIVMMMGGGSGSKHLPVAQMTNLSVGQTYTLKSANSYDPSATVRLVSVPGSMAAYDDTEEADRVGDCKHMPQGTKVKLLQVQDSVGSRFAKVEMVEGECAGKSAWTISTNVK